MLDAVKKGRVSEREVEVTAGGDQELSMEEAPETNSLCPSIPAKNRKQKRKSKVKINFGKIAFDYLNVIFYFIYF